MRGVFAAMAIVMMVAIAGPAAASTPAGATSEEQTILKKKKAAALKAEKKKAEQKQIAARKQAALAAARKKTGDQPRLSRRECGGFLECVFGKPRTRTSSGRMSDYATAKVVAWDEAGKYVPGSIIVRTPERALYYVLGDGKARRYKVGVGREGFQWSGNSRIVAKQEWPTWRPPQQMIEREAVKGHMLPDVMEGGPENPLGARAMYIGGTIFRIHGTNNAASIGGAVSSGCIRMMNTDVIELYKLVNVGARVYVYQ